MAGPGCSGYDEQAWFVADLDHVVIGAIFVNNEGGLAHPGMAVVAAHRGRGVGRALVARGIAWARDKSCHKVALEVWPHNVRARLYEWAGFQEEGYLKRHYRRRNGALMTCGQLGGPCDVAHHGDDANAIIKAQDVDSLAILPADPAAATEELQRRREEIGFSYFVFGADVADSLAPVVAELAGH